MNISIPYVRGDTNINIPFTLQDNSGNPIDLTNATLLFKAQHVDSPTLKFSGAITVLNATAGTCQYTTASTDFDTVGDYQCEIQITFTGGQVQTYPNIFVSVSGDIPL